MPRERDKNGRYLPKEGEIRDKVIRVTPSELKALQEAREQGKDPKKVLTEKAKEKS